jgi:hypothetical protein
MLVSNFTRGLAAQTLPAAINSITAIRIVTVLRNLTSLPVFKRISTSSAALVVPRADFALCATIAAASLTGYV